MEDLTEESGENSIQELIPIAIFGFNGQVKNGLKVHPDKNHIVFPFGNRISVINLKLNQQDFLNGHSDVITALDISVSGSLVGSGQESKVGTKAFVIIWDWETRSEKIRYDIHKLKVESICFSSSDRYLISLGGRDCGSVVVWDIQKNTALCAAKASKETTGVANKILTLQQHGLIFVTCGDQTFRVWSIEPENRKLKPFDVLVGKIRRQYSCLQIDDQDEVMYAGTMSGDLIKVKINCDPLSDAMCDNKVPVLIGCYGKHAKKKPPGKDCECYRNGIRQILLLEDGTLLIGTGDGVIELVAERNVNLKNYLSPTCPKLTNLNRVQISSPITSLDQLNDKTIIIGTESCEIYYLDLCSFTVKLSKTCHTSAISDIAFPYNFPYVFATAGHESIRLWSLLKKEELLRIVVPNFTATSVIFSRDGKSIISSWNDGVIRAFTPLTGKIIFTILNAHNKGCTCLTTSTNGRILVSGGNEGQVRVWSITPKNQSLIGILKEHAAAIASVDFNKFDNEVVSSSIDGTCIIWNVSNLTRKQVLFANTQFTCARYFPSGVHILTSGSDCRISYWEVYDGSLIRQVEGAIRGTINGLALNESGSHFVSVGSDQLVKLWDYQQGVVIGSGHGHASPILCCTYSPCGKFIVTGGEDGSIFIWNVPEDIIVPMTSNHSQAESKADHSREENICNHSKRKHKF